MPPRRRIHQVTLQLTAGAAPVAELGKMLGQTGVSLIEVKRRYDEMSAPQRGDVVPAEITVFDDRSFTLVLKTPPTSFLIRRALDRAGSPRPGHAPAGALTSDALRAIALRKLPDLTTTEIDKAMRIVAGTARSMGVSVVP